MANEGRGPLVVRDSLAAWERERRARLAVAEEAGELARMRAELRKPSDEKLGRAQKILRDLRAARGYRLMRRLGRWEWLERGIERALW